MTQAAIKAAGGGRTGANVPSPIILVSAYAVLVVVGAVLLKLPFSIATEVSWSDALFTATSAVTVTGLSVLSIGEDFTVFGQVVIAVLIQLGGLGLMAFAVSLMISLGLSVPLPQRVMLSEDLGQNSVAQVLSITTTVIRVIACLVVGGWVALAFVFVPDHGWAEGLWHALFMSVSSTNNAGFALFGDSLSAYATHPLVTLVISIQFILGGLGFVVLYDSLHTRRWKGLTLHTKLMFTGTALLIVVSVLTVSLLEWDNPATLGALGGGGDKLLAAFFTAVTPRTAGFNVVDTGELLPGTALFTIVLMIIGGGAGSTAGGIKVTTFFVAVLAAIAFFRRQERLTAFSHSIEAEQVMKVMALVSIVAGFVLTGLFFLVISNDADFLGLLFEAASAFGTVGLSRGITGELNEPGRLIIGLLMFVGRVGPVSFGFFLATTATSRIRFPKGTVYVA